MTSPSLAQPAPSLRGDPPAAASPQGLADRNALAAVAVERTRMPMVMTDPREKDNPIVLANRAFLQLTGYGARELVGRNCRLLQGEGTSAAAIAEIRAAVAAGREIDIEILNYRKDRTAFWNQLSLSPVYDDERRLSYYFGSQIDVTELRKVQTLEASEHRLLKEVDHRSRNVLAVVSGIVRLSRPDDAALYAAAIQQRVEALSRAHTLLAERGWREASLEDVIRQQIGALDGSRVKLDGPDVMISALVVQPIALAIHELAENAVTHGALARPHGELRVEWGAGARYGGFTLRWRESGGPPPPVAEPRRGFGGAMVTAMIERQLRGEIRREWTRDGLAVVITVPGVVETTAG